MLKLTDLIAAYDWVSADPSGENQACVNRRSGQVYWITDAVDLDEELPDDLDDGGKYIAVPNKYDLDLGTALVFRFVREHLADESAQVAGFFRGRGAYGRFKDFLARRQLLDTWYAYETSKVEGALLAWVSEHDIPYPTGAHQDVA
jgi:hypothetical protein